jgi:AhpD family alkylhydroperoxidase
MNTEKPICPSASRDIAKKREQLAPETLATFRSFSRQVFADGALPSKTKELIAVAVAHVTQCPYCIRSHTKSAQARGASGQEIMEAIWVAAEMGAGGAIAHSALAIGEMNEEAPRPE